MRLAVSLACGFAWGYYVSQHCSGTPMLVIMMVGAAAIGVAIGAVASLLPGRELP